MKKEASTPLFVSNIAQLCLVNGTKVQHLLPLWCLFIVNHLPLAFCSHVLSMAYTLNAHNPIFVYC